MTAATYLTSAFPSTEKISEDVERDGFQIYHDVISLSLYDEIREYWLNYFSKTAEKEKFVRGGFFFGEPNFNSYSSSHNWKLFRYFEFLWNSAAHELSRAVALEIHKKRNLVQGFDENYGLTLNEKRYGIYLSVSYYPPDGGYFLMHKDGHSDSSILHYMLPLTFKGDDYSDGGLVCYDKNGVETDVDAEMKPGSLVFFDGRQEHGVKPIGVSGEQKYGRLALFMVPVFFEDGSKLARWYRDTKNSLYFAAEGIAQKVKKPR